MGLGKDTANFVLRGIIGVVGVVFFVGLFYLITQFGDQYLTAHYAKHPQLPLMKMGLMFGTLIFLVILGKYITQVLLKGK